MTSGPPKPSIGLGRRLPFSRPAVVTPYARLVEVCCLTSYEPTTRLDHLGKGRIMEGKYHA